MCDQVNYREQAEEVAAALQNYCKDTEWTTSKQTADFKIFYKRSPEFEGYLYKGEAVYAAKPKVVFDYVEPLPSGPRAKWDKNMKKIEIIKQIEDDLRINRACTSSACMGLISPRDFVDLILIKETDEYLSTNAKSVVCSDCPQDKEHVRGVNHKCGMIVFKYPNEPNKCKLVSLIQPDTKGHIPRSLQDAAIPGSMIEFFTQLRETLAKDGQLYEQD
uniref:Mimachlamys nobilis stAR-related lipid transfer protein 5-like protein mRNA n=1 Tax=Mimachlamys nobilis TaxID=106276 RepID=A0A0C5B1A6_MIMNO|nr:stAR-related lipid transfer protein 5-like protein [Mimachlamys nobilis]